MFYKFVVNSTVALDWVDIGTPSLFPYVLGKRYNPSTEEPLVKHLWYVDGASPLFLTICEHFKYSEVVI